MKKLLLLFFSILSISLNVQAFNEKEFLCKAFQKIQTHNDDAILEAISLWDDYIVFKKGGKSAFPTIWKNLVNQDEIYTISLQKMKNYVPNEKKQKFNDFIKDTDKNKEDERGTFKRYLETLKNCSFNTKETLSRLKQKILDDEVQLFLKRTNGKKLYSKPLEYFTLINQPIHPSKEFIYKYKLGNIHDLRLRIIQVVPSGILVQADSTENDLLQYYGTSADKTIFIETTFNYVDKDLLHDGFYEYLGTKSYNSLTGNRTIHSFKEISDPFDHIFFYKGND